MRHFLNGRFENSVFCILDPTGNKWLTRSGRGPEHVFGNDQGAISQMGRIASTYRMNGQISDAVVQDFHSVRQAINVASADQRVLVLIAGPEAKLDSVRQSLRTVASHHDVVGRFHVDFDSGSDWRETISGLKNSEGILMIQSDEFGMAGTILEQLPLAAGSEAILSALKRANASFAATTPKKVYSAHVRKGFDQKIYFEGTVPYGEDRDGDGKIDGKGPKGRGKGPPSRK